VVRARLDDGCPDATHILYARAHDAVPVVEGWLRKATRAAKAASLAVARNDPAAARQALARCELALTKARRECGRELTARTRLADLADLGRRKRKAWGLWASEVATALADVRRGMAAARAGLGTCWRELAGQAGAGVVVNNVSVGHWCGTDKPTPS
jgi:hypothetical protein